MSESQCTVFWSRQENIEVTDSHGVRFPLVVMVDHSCVRRPDHDNPHCCRCGAVLGEVTDE